MVVVPKANSRVTGCDGEVVEMNHTVGQRFATHSYATFHGHSAVLLEVRSIKSNNSVAYNVAWNLRER